MQNYKMKIKVLGCFAIVVFLQPMAVVSDFLKNDGSFSEAKDTVLLSTFEPAMLGYDPVISNPYAEFDPGLKSRIFDFNPHKFSYLPDFIGRAQLLKQCDADREPSTVTLKTYEEYRRHIMSGYSFVSDSAATFFTEIFGARQFGEEEAKIKNFFTKVQGEIVMAEAPCKVHLVDLLSGATPQLSRGFYDALKKLNAGASTNSDAAFKTFVEAFGTHYIKGSVLGSRISYIKSFSQKSSTIIEENARRECIKLAAARSLSSRTTFFSTEAEKCDDTASTEEDIIVVKSTGALSSANYLDWSNRAKHAPVHLQMKLEKISSMFTTDWFKSLMSGECSNYWFNASALYEYFERKSSDYCNIFFDEDDICRQKTGCGLSVTCSTGQTCEDGQDGESSKHKCTQNYGDVVIVGGWTNEVSQISDLNQMSSEPQHHHISNKLVDMPNSLYSPTLSIVSSDLYLCGGRNSNSNKDACYILTDFTTNRNPRWNRAPFSLPESMYYHTAVTVGSHIWIMYNGSLYDISTSTGVIESYNIPFANAVNNCAVSNGTHSIAIGVGENRDEIWINEKALSPEKWIKLAKMSRKRFLFGCLLFQDQVFITGGRDTYDSVEILDLKTNELSGCTNLERGRAYHQMFVLGGKPAVVGGWKHEVFLDSIETYDINTNSWSVNLRKLDQPKSNFAIAQLKL